MSGKFGINTRQRSWLAICRICGRMAPGKKSSICGRKAASRTSSVYRRKADSWRSGVQVRKSVSRKNSTCGTKVDKRSRISWKISWLDRMEVKKLARNVKLRPVCKIQILVLVPVLPVWPVVRIDGEHWGRISECLSQIGDLCISQRPAMASRSGRKVDRI